MRERIEAGKLFTDECEGLPKERTKCKKHMNEFNASSPTNLPARYLAMTKLFGKVTKAWIEPPFYELDVQYTSDTMYGFWKDTLIIDYYHPACHYPNRVNYYALMSICRMASKEWRDRKIAYAQ